MSEAERAAEQMYDLLEASNIPTDKPSEWLQYHVWLERLVERFDPIR